jgi:uncharacterized OsmC-like protein
LVLLALTSSAVLAATDTARWRTGAPPSVVSRATFTTARQRIDGPMATIAQMAELRHRLELGLGGDFGGAQALIDAAGNCPVARALQRAISVRERVDFVTTDGPRVLDEFINETMLAAETEFAAAAPLGERVVSAPEGRWRVSAERLGDDAVLLQHGAQTYVGAAPGSSRAVGPSPNELLAASLAACTVYYIAHNARFASIPVRSIDATVSAVLDDSDAVISLDNVATVSGNLTNEEMDSIRFIAGHCYVGMTMKDGVHVSSEVELTSDTPGSAAPEGFAREAVDAACDDGSCCIPDFAQPQSTVHGG